MYTERFATQAEAIDVLTGMMIPSDSLRRVVSAGIHKHSLWVSATDLQRFMESAILNTTGLTLLKDARPVTISRYTRRIQFYNIAQTSDPMALFEYCLYKRQFSSSTNRSFIFDEQCELHEHSRKHGFTENMWVTKAFLSHFLKDEFRILHEASSIRLSQYVRSLYNIEQLSDSVGFKNRITYTPRAIIGGKKIRSPLSDDLYDVQRRNGYTLPLWCSGSELQRLGSPLQGGMRGAVCRTVNGPRRFFNIEQFTDPLVLFRTHSLECRNTFSCADLFTRKTFRRADVVKLCEFREETGFHSKFWVQPKDMQTVGAVCLPSQRGRTVRCSSGEWYNMHQMGNWREVMENVYLTGLRSKPKENSLDMFESIIS